MFVNGKLYTMVLADLVQVSMASLSQSARPGGVFGAFGLIASGISRQVNKILSVAGYNKWQS